MGRLGSDWWFEIPIRVYIIDIDDCGIKTIAFSAAHECGDDRSNPRELPVTIPQ